MDVDAGRDGPPNQMNGVHDEPSRVEENTVTFVENSMITNETTHHQQVSFPDFDPSFSATIFAEKTSHGVIESSTLQQPDIKFSDAHTTLKEFDSELKLNQSSNSFS